MTGILHSRIGYLLFLSSFILLLSALPVHAISVEQCVAAGGRIDLCEEAATNAVNEAGSNTVLEGSLGGKSFDNPLGPNREVKDVVENVLRAVLGIIGIAALVMFTYGGIVWMTAAGSQDRVRLGRDTLKWATLGLVVVFTSFAIINFILSAFKST